MHGTDKATHVTTRTIRLVLASHGREEIAPETEAHETHGAGTPVRYVRPSKVPGHVVVTLPGGFFARLHASSVMPLR